MVSNIKKIAFGIRTALKKFDFGYKKAIKKMKSIICSLAALFNKR